MENQLREFTFKASNGDDSTEIKVLGKCKQSAKKIAQEQAKLYEMEIVWIEPTIEIDGTARNWRVSGQFENYIWQTGLITNKKEAESYVKWLKNYAVWFIKEDKLQHY